MAGLAIVASSSASAQPGRQISQAEIVSALQLKHGGWKTGLVIEEAKVTPKAGSTVPPESDARLKSMVGLRHETRDCITDKVQGQGKLILPGIAIADISAAEWTAHDGQLKMKLRVGELDAFHTVSDISSSFTPQSMATVMNVSVSADWGSSEMRIKLDSVYEGACQL